MKILVLSDSHGNLNNIKKATDAYGKNANVIVHCGDGTRGEAEWIKQNCKNNMVVCVKGNCDFGSTLNDVEILSLEGFNVMITHGHLYGVKMGLTNLSYKAEENNCNMVLFGHTHIPTDETIGNIRMINPGSASYYAPTCAVVEFDYKQNVLVNIIKI